MGCHRHARKPSCLLFPFLGKFLNRLTTEPLPSSQSASVSFRGFPPELVTWLVKVLPHDLPTRKVKKSRDLWSPSTTLSLIPTALQGLNGEATEYTIN